MKVYITLLWLALAMLANLAQAGQPNFVYFLIDDLGRADCGFMGGKDIRTPSIDRLAKSGAILDAFYVQPVCSPTRSTLMTGRYVTHTGVYTIVRPHAPWGLPLNERLLPQALKEVGYTTAICGKWHLGDYQPEYKPTSRGFDHQYGHLFGAIDYFTHVRDGDRDWYRDDQPLDEAGYSTHLVAREAVKIIQEQPKDKPLYLYVPFNGIHAPHQVPEEYKEPYQSLKEPRRTIAGMLAAVDEAIGKIVGALEEKGIREETLIMFSSDNGGPGPGRQTMNTPFRAGKGTIYEGGIRVCAFANWPGKIKEGVVVKEPVHAVDWYPTLLRLAGASTKQEMPVDGLDIWPVITEGKPTPHDAILLMGTRPGRVAIRMGDWKLLKNASDRDAEEAGSESKADKDHFELYNLAADPGESKDVASQEAARVDAMRKRLDELLADAVQPGNEVVQAPRAKNARRQK